MELKKILSLLEEQINIKMIEFSKLGKEIKVLLKKVRDKENQMASIFKELEPVHSVIREQNPPLCDMFDSLIELDKENKAKKFIENSKEYDGNK